MLSIEHQKKLDTFSITGIVTAEAPRPGCFKIAKIIRLMSDKKEQGNPLAVYLRGAYAELRKVTWPTRKETWRKSWIVIGFSIAFAAFLGGLDYLLTIVLEALI